MPLHGYFSWEAGVRRRYILGESGWVDIFYEWVRVGGGIFWVGGDMWKYVLGGWWWLNTFY